MSDPVSPPISLGKIAGVFGTRGWLKVMSFTRPQENILTYTPWLLAVNGTWLVHKIVEYRIHAKRLVVSLDGVSDRDLAAALIGVEIGVWREQLPETASDEYYWSDLLGLEVSNQANIALGKVTRLYETGANDVLVVKGDRERLIPFVVGRYVTEIDLVSGRMRVDWDPED